MINKTILFVVLLILTFGTASYAKADDPKGADPSGVITGTANDVPAAIPWKLQRRPDITRLPLI
jgi:hypothetical protein